MTRTSTTPANSATPADAGTSTGTGPADPVRLAVIIGSVRAGRYGPTVARWFTGEITGRDDVVVDVVDLLGSDLAPRMDRDPDPDLGARLAAADAFVVVTPEYNHSYPAGLKIAIDAFHSEWAAKPVGFVSYGGRSGGIRAVEHLRTVFVELHGAPVRDAVSLPDYWTLFDDDGALTDDGSAAQAAQLLAGQLVWWGRALRDARARHGALA
ncbi:MULTISPECIES: NADPH-dependent FMN reductase [Pseudonocardia]|uniref:FMN-dependent NADPH-azoreductase n=2 Tax=Pseudonocardia TaxID=1847 RepID=A0A1Y2N6I9_PSEAH|nr:MULTISPECIES: NAD(P)H-dependent oxidoreductase [Pseudonocardia]OSY43073.1 FMN-dependent NADPH-azoreductase [Pseudonocardia autotrophica]TDN71561.1 NAD(P)H-dependent FMN reductase [Pseudonocardia autotrophica]BBG02251.1 putative reductase [Pseudonocardia autotrophica]GEC23414.1 putative reductase [Pseudonocardia saturnea]